MPENNPAAYFTEDCNEETVKGASMRTAKAEKECTNFTLKSLTKVTQN